MKKIVVSFLVLACCFCFSSCKKADNLEELSANLSTYSMEILLNTQEKRADVNETVNYINNTNSILKLVKFHVYPQFFKEGAVEKVVGPTKMNDAYPNGMSYAEFNFNSVLVNNENEDVVLTGENESVLELELPYSLMPNKSINLQFNFSLTLPNVEHRFGYGENTINLANFYPIACVFENGEFSTCPYNSNGDPFYSDMANYNVKLTINKNYLVASTGELTAKSEDANHTSYVYKANMVRDFAIVASDKFEVVSARAGNTDVNYYSFNDENKRANLKAGVDAINTFNKLFGSYPYKTFNIVKTDFIYGGMEYPNLIMISADVVDADDYKNVIVHETAHQWWYGLVGNDEYNAPWLDEALTEYSSILFYDYNEGYNFTHAQMIKASKENYTLFLSVYNDVLGEIDTSMRPVNEYATEPEYTYCTYVKGVLMYESLYQIIGEKNFIKSLNFYFENNKYKNATKENLIYAFETISKTELKNFFDSFIKGKVIIK